MEGTYVHTPIGMIDISEEIPGFVPAERPGVTIGREVVIKTCLTQIVITNKDGSKHVIKPMVVASCMNPEIKSIIPVSVRSIYSDLYKRTMIYVSTQYENRLLDSEADVADVKTERFVPQLADKSI